LRREKLERERERERERNRSEMLYFSSLVWREIAKKDQKIVGPSTFSFLF
jgi:hypothetical protein